MKKLLFLTLPALLLLSGAHPPRPGKDLAIFFAIEQYKNWPKLNYPIDEAEAIAASLHDVYGFDTLILRNPEKREILGKLEELLAGEFAPDGQLLLFFSGHGAFREDTKEGHFIPADGVAGDKFQESYISYQTLRRRVNGIPCEHILLAIDACYAGTLDDEVAFRSGPGDWKRPGEGDRSQREVFIQKQLEDKTRLFIAAGGKVRTPDKSKFARYFQEALISGGGAEGVLTFNTLSSFLEKADPKPHMAGFLDHKGGNFLFINQSWSLEEKTLDDEDERFWKLVIHQDTKELYASYLQVYPEGRHSAAAKEQMKRFPQPWVTADGEVWGGENIEKKIPDYMVLVDGGTFQMGDHFGEGGSDEIKHTVTVNSFLLAKYELTFKEYDAFCEAMKLEKPSDVGWGRDTRPVINVSWLDAVEYCNWRSMEEGLTPAYTIQGEKVTCNWSVNGYRLPTEAEWEYAARQKGQKVRFGNGKDIADTKEINLDGIHYSTSYSIEGIDRQKTVSVGSLNCPNSLGLHDMSGNVWEWCWDWYGSDYYINSPAFSPKGPESGSDRVIRGGSWINYPASVRAADRYSYSPDYWFSTLGFRLARTF